MTAAAILAIPRDFDAFELTADDRIDASRRAADVARIGLGNLPQWSTFTAGDIA